jgi:hypothetical protein
MPKRTLTLRLDEEVILQARIVAAHRGLSLNALVAHQLIQLTRADQRYDRARAVALDALGDAADRGRPSWRREELYER